MPETAVKMRAILLVAVLIGAFPGALAAQTLERQWALCRADNAERVIAACTAVIRASRHSAENLARAFFNRGRAWSDNGQFDRAIKDFDQAIHFDPNYPEAFNNRGVALSGLGQYEQAIVDFDAAIKLDPNYAIAIYNRGLASQNLGRSEEAAQYFARARQVGPRLTPPKE
jgi:tetratricopeptide (TPR) repeat protein